MGLKEIVDFDVWTTLDDRDSRFPLLNAEQWMRAGEVHPELNFLALNLDDLRDDLVERLQPAARTVLVLDTENEHGLPEQRRAFFELINAGIDLPVVIRRRYRDLTDDKLLLYASTDIGGLLIDGLGDGAWLDTSALEERPASEWKKLVKFYNSTSFGILQAARTRMTKTEYISCPSCGRTLFDLQETTAKIRKRTDHLKGVKIGIMGCIVNGPGEMADADYGYVGSGVGKITLYRGKEIVKRNVPAELAVDELIGLIAEDGRWIEAEQLN
jgi:(E)-4-hydroxy-3-methylbut-2-enyl-diphosphate synthase